MLWVLQIHHQVEFSDPAVWTSSDPYKSKDTEKSQYRIYNSYLSEALTNKHQYGQRTPPTKHENPDNPLWTILAYQQLNNEFGCLSYEDKITPHVSQDLEQFILFVLGISGESL